MHTLLRGAYKCLPPCSMVALQLVDTAAFASLSDRPNSKPLSLLLRIKTRGSNKQNTEIPLRDRFAYSTNNWELAKL